MNTWKLASKIDSQSLAVLTAIPTFFARSLKLSCCALRAAGAPPRSPGAGISYLSGKVGPPLLSPRPVLRDTFEPDLSGPDFLLPGEEARSSGRRAATGSSGRRNASSTSWDHRSRD